MSFADELAGLQAEAYATFGVDLLLLREGFSPILLRALPDNADATASFEHIGRRRVARAVYRVRVSEMEASAPGFQPKPGDGVQVGVEAFEVVNQPERKDKLRTEWTLECG